MTAEELYERIIERRYWFAAARDPLRENLTPVCLVAMRSQAGESWAAYIAGVGTYRAEDDDMAAHVARHGAKIDEAAARAMFPDVDLPYRK